MNARPSLRNVVGGGACSGCGVCAGVAPCGRLEMRLTSEGVYQPTWTECSDCGLCAEVCPAGGSGASDSARPLGRVVATYVGYSMVGDERVRAASGGLTTRVLKTLLERDWVDTVVAVAATGQREPLFLPAALRTSADVHAAASSKYYPVEFSRPLRELRESGERFALVGLPCVITALRQGMQRLSWLSNQCRCLIGLTCGHLATTHYTTFLAALTGVPPGSVRRVNYRSGAGPGGAGDYCFVATEADGTTGDELPFFSGRGIPAAIWGARLFTPEACFRCTDLFAVNADLTLMDAWLPEYRSERAGTSLAVVRAEWLRDLLEDELRAGRVHLEPIAAERVIESQAGALARRREALAWQSAAMGSEARLPLRRRALLGWERSRSKLSNRLFAGGPLRQRIGVRVVLMWLTMHRAGLRLRSAVSRLMHGRGV